MSAGVAWHVAAPSPVSCAAARTECLSWGYNQFGQLGQGDDDDRALPEVIQDLENKHGVTAVSHGSSNSSAVITKNGDLYTFGHGRDGRLGHGWTPEGSPENLPRLVTDLKGQVAQVALGEFHGVCLTKDAKVFSWGKSFRRGNILGHDETHGRPAAVQGLEGFTPVKVACGRLHTVVVTEDGKVLTFGSGKVGQLGHGDSADSKLPKVVEGLAGHHVVDVACGKEHTLVLTAQGKVFAFGYDQYGQLGQGQSSRYQKAPVAVSSLDSKGITKIVAGEHFSYAISRGGDVYSWGFGLEGQLGHGDEASVAIPKFIQALDGVPVSDAACGSAHTLLKTADGKLMAFGRGRNGQLGRGDTLESVAAYRTTPQPLHFFEGRTIRSVACGGNHSLAIVDADA